MITPADIENKVFTKAVRGYKEEEVDDFLDLIILDMEKLIKENRQLKKELEKAQGQVDRHVSTESSVYETLEAAKSLMNDIAASAERRAQVILKDAELEAALITREARESIARLTDEETRMRRSVEHIREKYRQMLELELERVEMMGTGLFEEFSRDFIPEPAAEQMEAAESAEPAAEKADSKDGTAQVKAGDKKELSKTVVNIR